VIYDEISEKLNDLYECCCESFGMMVLELKVEALLNLVERLKDDFGFDLLLDVTAVDYPDREQRFDLVYHLYSSRHNVRIRLKSTVGEGGQQAPTLTQWYGSAAYLEREVHEMYGVRFEGNGDLRPILLYEGFEGHPLRKDYPIDREQPLVDYRK